MKTAIQQLQEYSDELIRNGISPEEYMTNISVKMWTMLNKTFEEQLLIEDAYRDGYNKGYMEGRLNKVEIPFKMPIDYFNEKFWKSDRLRKDKKKT